MEQITTSAEGAKPASRKDELVELRKFKAAVRAIVRTQLPLLREERQNAENEEPSSYDAYDVAEEMLEHMASLARMLGYKRV